MPKMIFLLYTNFSDLYIIFNLLKKNIILYNNINITVFK